MTGEGNIWKEGIIQTVFDGYAVEGVRGSLMNSRQETCVQT